MQLICSNCNQPVNPENINITTDLAKCGKCGAIYKASALVSAGDDKKLIVPPAGSAVEVTKELGDMVRIYFPEKGFTASDIPAVLFAIFWLSFITFWTWGASQGSIIFALFSIPFWLVGIMMVGGIINGMFETQTLTAGGGQIVLEKNRPLFPKRHEFTFSGIQAIKMTPMKTGAFSTFSNSRLMFRRSWSYGVGMMLPAIISGAGTIYFFEAANDAEQEWVTQYLDNKRRQAK